MTPEGKVKARVKKVLKAAGAYQFWPVQMGYGAATVDCIGCYKKMFYAIETKAPGKHPTPRQELTIKDMRDAEGAVFVIGESFEDGEYSGMQSLIEWLTAVMQQDD